MMKRISKSVLCIALAGMLALSSTGAASAAQLGEEGILTQKKEIDKQAAKLVTYKTLGKVTGFGQVQNENENYLYWNKVANTDAYYIKLIENSTGNYANTWAYTPRLEYLNKSFTWRNSKGSYIESSSGLADGTYTININAESDHYYLYAANISEEQRMKTWDEWDTYVYLDDAKTRCNTYKSPTGPVSTFTFTVNNKKAVTTSISSLGNIRLKEVSNSYADFEVIKPPTLNLNERVYWEISNNSQFLNRGAGNKCTIYTKNTASENLSVNLNSYYAGNTIYIRAHVYNSSFTGSNRYGVYTNVASYTLPQPKIKSITTSVKASSITISPFLRSGMVTGYEYAKKVGSKWVSLGTYNSDSYTDNGLKKNQKYDYRVRAYVYNKDSKKTTWSKWSYTEATTWGANLNMYVHANSSTSAKLQWNKVSDAQGYEIYRKNTDSYTSTYQNGIGVESFTDYTLIKTIKKASTKTYTDKKLKANGTYSYIVRAYKTINKKKSYIEDYDSITLGPDSLKTTASYYTSNGSYKVTWKKMTGIKGYLVEKKNTANNKFEKISTLKSSATSYTFASLPISSGTVNYRIRPFDAGETYSGSTFTVNPVLGVVNNVKAKQTAEGIQISWSPVAGADYYNVYRTPTSKVQYNKTAKYYYRQNNTTTVYDAAVNTTGYNPSLHPNDYIKSTGTYRTSAIAATSVVDKTVSYPVASRDAKGDYIVAGTLPNGAKVYQTEDYVYNEGPDAGVAYNYYVCAYSNAASGKPNVTGLSSLGYSKPASAIYTSKKATKVSKITKAKSTKKRTATISFKKAKGVSGYAIYRSTSKKGKYVLVGTTSSKKSTISFTDRDLTSRKTYYYKVGSFVRSESGSNIYSNLTNYKAVRIK